ncbi:MAG: hypothetical protein RR209_02040 [Angelakisella sp.]
MKKMLCIFTAISLLLLAALPASATVNGIFLGSDENGVNIVHDRLRPGEEYYFPVLIAMQVVPPMQLTSSDMERCKLEVRVATGGKAIASAKIEEKNGLVYLCVIPGSRGTVQELTATLRINYRNRDTGENLTVIPSLRVGYEPLPEEAVSALVPDEFLIFPNLTPIVSAKQWNALAELNGYRDVTLSGIGWRFTVNTGGLGKRNLVVDHHPVMELVKKHPHHQMHFIGFPSEPDFEVGGRLWLDVSEFAEEYKESFYLYRCAYGKVYPLKFDYDSDSMELTFRPTQLGTYLITDKKITASEASSSSDSASGDTPTADNPNTGTAQGFPAAAVAVLALAGLGAACSYRRR